MPQGSDSKKSSRSYTLYHQLSITQKPIKIGAVVPDSWNKQTDRKMQIDPSFSFIYSNKF